MTCEQVREQSVVEAYLMGRLPEQERDAFELHYLECDRCFADVEAMRAVQGALRSMPVSRATPIAPAKPMFPVWRRSGWILSAAAVLVLSAIVVERFNQPFAPPRVAVVPQPAVNLYAELARFDPPPFSAVKLRGPAQPSESAFQQAMENYTRRDWPACESALIAVSAQYPQTIKARYYQGVCALLANHPAVGEAALRDTIAAGATPYLEEAHFYLAKALLSRADAEGARAELRKTIAMGGDLEQPAIALAARLP
jgi:anti-sigma factor RsiW